VTAAPNILLIVLDDLREDGLGAALEQPDRCMRAATCLATAPWTLPSVTSIVTGVTAAHHRHFWRDPPLPANRLLAALPTEYRKVGFVNNGAISAGSGVESGFDRWSLTLDHDVPFRKALRMIKRAGRRRPCFILLHSNIVHDYCLPVTDRYLPPGSLPVLDDRVISWKDTTPEDRAAAVSTYGICADVQRAKVEEVLDAVRERDDFITAVTSDHGEGFDYELGRIHHGGRLHQDLLHVPLYFDLPSTIRAAPRAALAQALDSQVLASTDIVPTLFDLAGVGQLPDVDGRPAGQIGERTLVGEDRRYLYLDGRFRLNYRGHNKHMTAEDLERNQGMLDQLATGPLVRSFVRHPRKLIVTALTLEAGLAAESGRDRLIELGGRLLGSPVFALHGDRLLAFEEFDLDADPLEQRNLLRGTSGWGGELQHGAWSSTVTMPAPDGTELALADLVDGAEFVELSDGAAS
jgi:Sulfatase